MGGRPRSILVRLLGRLVTVSDECPSEQVLIEFAGGRLDDAARQPLAAHLGACEQCREALGRLRAQQRVATKSHEASESGATSAWQTADQDELQVGSEDLESRFDITLLAASTRAGALGSLGKYHILRTVGHGGMGVLFEAYDERLQRTVAIKVLNRALSSSATARRRFIREARAAAAVNHPNVVTIHAVEEHAHLPFIVMEFVHGGALRDRLRQEGQLRALAAIRISSQIAAGLAAAHAQGVIHRDVKPGNVMLEGGERVKIADFGLARAASDNVDLTSAGRALGTPTYMAPEQVSGKKIDARADLFALGCVMFAMVNGRSPFHGQNVLEIAHNVLHLEPPRLDVAGGDVPPFYADVVARLLEKDPTRRYQSAAEVADILNRHLTQLNQATSDELPGLLAPADVRRVPPGRWGKPLAAAVAGLTLILLVAAGSLWLAGRVSKPGNGSSNPSAPVAKQSTQAARVAPRVAGGVRTVAKAGKANFRSLSDALRDCQPGTQIRVLDDAVYEEAVVLDQAAQHRQVTLEAVSGATWAARQGAVPLTIRDVPQITVRGFRLPLQASQHGILVSGVCPGLVLENLELSQPADSPLAAIVVKEGTTGTRDEPLLLRQLTVRAGWMGLVIYGLPEAPIRWVRVEDCRFFGARKGESVDVLLENAAEDVSLVGNWFCTASAGISISMPRRDALRRLSITRNTFFSLSHWLRWNSTDPLGQEVEIGRNLVLETDGVQFPAGADVPRFASWFRDNVWEFPANDALNERAEAQQLATLQAHVEVASRDPTHRAFLQVANPKLPGAVLASSPHKSLPGSDQPTSSPAP